MRKLKNWMAYRIRLSTKALEVQSVKGGFYVIVDIETTECYYGHMLLSPLGYDISLLEGAKIVVKNLFKKKAPKPKAVIFPAYGEVLSTITPEECKKCFIAYEVMELSDINSAKENAEKYLRSIADKYNWDYDTFYSIIWEEYIDIRIK